MLVTIEFPGNVRELRNIVIRLTARHPGQVVAPDQLLAEFDTSDDVDRASRAAVVENNYEQRCSSVRVRP